MPKCQRCGAHVMEQTVRVLYPPEVEQPNGCAHCPDMTLTPQGYREMRNQDQ